MRFGLLKHGWWDRACSALRHDIVELPTATHASGNAYAANLAGRIANGPNMVRTLSEQPVDMILDNGGVGLGFVTGADGSDNLKLAHEVAGVPLVSHFIDPLVTAFQGLDWTSVWQCLQSTSWIKAVWDKAQVLELRAFGVPHVMHLPMAAVNRPYNTDPIDPSATEHAVSFVGNQNTSYFNARNQVPAHLLFPGALAHAVRGDLPNLNFYEIYHDLYGVGAAIAPDDDLETRTRKTLAYFAAKLHYNASLCIRNRDRFVIFLRRQLGDTFKLLGNGWDTTYGLATLPPIPSDDGYFEHFRKTAVNINLVNGNSEGGVNMRHFEITAAGGFMLCYDQPELEDHFEIGKECAVFHNESDLIEKIQYYLSHADERVAIALAGQRRTLASHLYSHRLEHLLGNWRSLQAPPVAFSDRNWADDCLEAVPEADVILDCGANVGQMAAAFRRYYPNANIYSFEPATEAFDKLRDACAALNVRPVNLAVADQEGTASLNLTASPEANSLLSFQEHNPCAKWTREVGKEQVTVCTLDHWCDHNGIDPARVDILKLDVQGAELKALIGAPRVLEHARAVFLEVSFVPIYKDCPLFAEIDDFLTHRGFRRHAIYPSDQPHNWGDALYIKVPETANVCTPA